MIKGLLSTRCASLVALLFLVAVMSVFLAGCKEGTDESATPPPSGAPASPEDSSASAPPLETQPAASKNKSPGAERRDEKQVNRVTIVRERVDATDAAGNVMTVPELSPAQLAKKFSANFPVYTGATLDVSTTSETGDTTFVASMETPDDISKVIDFYNEALPKNGFDIAMTMDVPEGKMIHFQKGDKTTGAVTITTQDQKTVAAVSLMVSK